LGQLQVQVERLAMRFGNTAADGGDRTVGEQPKWLLHLLEKGRCQHDVVVDAQDELDRWRERLHGALVPIPTRVGPDRVYGVAERAHEDEQIADRGVLLDWHVARVVDDQFPMAEGLMDQRREQDGQMSGPILGRNGDGNALIGSQWWQLWRHVSLPLAVPDRRDELANRVA